jgi:hypothetical protein
MERIEMTEKKMKEMGRAETRGWVLIVLEVVVLSVLARKWLPWMKTHYEERLRGRVWA